MTGRSDSSVTSFVRLMPSRPGKRRLSSSPRILRTDDAHELPRHAGHRRGEAGRSPRRARSAAFADRRRPPVCAPFVLSSARGTGRQPLRLRTPRGATVLPSSAAAPCLLKRRGSSSGATPRPWSDTATATWASLRTAATGRARIRARAARRWRSYAYSASVTRGRDQRFRALIDQLAVDAGGLGRLWYSHPLSRSREAGKGQHWILFERA